MYIKRILWIAALLGLLGCAYFAYKVYDALFLPNTAFQDGFVHVYVPTESNFANLKVLLAPYLDDMQSFEAVAGRKKYSSNVKPGKYELRRGMNNNQIVNTLRSGNQPVRVSFNNQETFGLLAARIASQIEADSLSLKLAFEDTSFLLENGFTERSGLSMYIPNSYEFFWNTSALEFRDRMLAEYRKFWNEERIEKATALGLNPVQVSILAAIVHKETARTEERPRVAGVYLNRLKKNMPLQADPTVIYALKLESGNFDTLIRRVLYQDLRLESPYNTYRHAGLPPGPIAMPDISAIEAVINAERHDYYYFVANVENFGYHVFARTLEQHNRNKAQYIRWINDQKIKR